MLFVVFKPNVPPLFILPINRKTEEIDSAQVKKIPTTHPQRETIHLTSHFYGKLTVRPNAISLKDCHSAFLFCFVSGVCASVVHTQNGGRGRGCVWKERGKSKDEGKT